MTVSVLRNQVQYTGNNSTTQFTVNFPYTEKSQVKVYLGGTLQTITTHYTLTDPDSTGTVTFVTAPGTGVVVSFIRETDFLQTVDYANNDILDAETLEAAFDKLTMMCQQVKNLADKSVGFDETVNESETTSLKLAAGTGDLAGKLLAFDSTGAFVTTQEIGTFRGDYSASVSYVVRDLVRDAATDNVYFTLQDAPAPADLTDTDYFELLVDVETVRTLKEAAETAKTGAETAETNAEAALASFQGQYKSSATDPYGGSADAGDLWYDETNSILKYYTGSAFEPVTTSLATVTGNYLTISNQVITAGTVPVSLGGTGATTASGARTALGVDPAGTDNSTDVTLAGSLDYLTISGQAITRNAIDLTTDVTGALPVANGGTGSTTASDARTALGVDPAGTDNSTDVTLATVTGNYLSLSGQQITAGTVPVTLGGTGSTTASDARTALGVDPAGTDNSTDITLATVTDNYLTLSGQEITAGTVPVSLGGTGSTTASDARTALGVDPAGTDNSTNVTLVTTSHDYLSLSSQAITLGPIVLTTDVSGALPVANGGTGSTTASDARTALGLGFAAKTNVSNSFTTNQIITSSSNTNPALRVTQTGVADALRIEDQSNPDSTPFIIDTFGRVGIGVSTVSDSLHIEGSSSPAIRLRDTQVANTYSQISASNNSLTINADAGNDAASGSLSIKISDITKLLINKTDGVVLYDDLVVNGNSIVSTSGGNISITPDTTGKIVLDGLSWPTADGTTDQVLQTDGAGNLSFVDQSGGGLSDLEHSNSVSTAETISSGNHRFYVGPVNFTNTVTLAGKMLIFDGLYNTTGTINITGTLHVRG